MAKFKAGEVVNFTGCVLTQYQPKQKVTIVRQHDKTDIIDVIFPAGSLYAYFKGGIIASNNDTPQAVYANSLKKIRVRKPKEAA